MITEKILIAMYPAMPKPGEWVRPMRMACEKYHITTPAREAAFLAQTSHECGGMAGFADDIARGEGIRENMNYGTPGLLATFGKYFPDKATADAYARQPQKIANRVYANRMGNGPETSGDGWKFRGNGLIQLTGKETIRLFSVDMNMSVEDAVTYLTTPEGICMSGAWFWGHGKLNQFADNGDFTTLTRRINGGTNGLESRKALYEKAKRLLGL